MIVEFNLKLPARVRKQGVYYVSHCPALDVYSQGPTERKALENLVEALQLFITSCYERGSLDTVLKDCGFSPVIRRRRKQTKLASGCHNITVPLPFKAPTRSLCHA